MISDYKYKTIKEFIQTFDDGIHQPHVVVLPKLIGGGLVQLGYPGDQALSLKLIASASRNGVWFNDDEKTIQAGLRFQGKPVELTIPTDTIIALYESVNDFHVTYPKIQFIDSVPPEPKKEKTALKRVK